MKELYCPFIKGPCRDDCVFRCNDVAIDRNIVSCLIAVKLSDINDNQYDMLVNIHGLLESK